MTIEGRLAQDTVHLPDDTQISYFVGGVETGDPVILLHGGGTDHALLSWRDTIPALLDAGYRVYAPSYPGYGNSPAANKPSTMDNLIRYLTALLDMWNIDRATLVGVSMGGAMALGYALAQLRRVNGLVLVGTYGIQDQAPFHRLSYLLVNLPWLINFSWALARGSRWSARYSLRSIIRNPASLTDELIDEVYAAMQNRSSQRAFAEWQRDEILPAGIKTNYMERLHEINVPVLLVHGSADVLVPLKYAQQAAPRFQNARLEVIDNAGHWTQRDYPDRFNDLLLTFLGKIDA